MLAANPVVALDHVSLTRKLSRNQTFTAGFGTLAFETGTATAVIGCNGSGKTTLLNLIAKIERPQHGAVRWSDDLAVAYLPQDRTTAEWLPLRVRDVLAMGRYRRLGAIKPMRVADKQAINEAVERFDIGDLLGQQFRHLSGGQRQRTLLAQCLAQRPDLLLMDEPITGLDLPSQKIILDFIEGERNAGMSFVISTHQMIEATLADRVLVLNEGHVVDDGAPADVLLPVRLQASLGIEPGGAPDLLFAMLARDHLHRRRPGQPRPGHTQQEPTWQR